VSEVDVDMVLEHIDSPTDLKALSIDEVRTLAEEIRAFIVEKVSVTGGHLGSNLGAVEITLALHRVFDSPRDILLWDTGHQAYAHKIVTGRKDRFDQLRQKGGLSGYPNRRESPHDWVENSHASTILSYAYGLASALELQARSHPSGVAKRRIVAVVGDGALTGGMAYEALNNLGHSGRRVVIVLNDNGRSYAPTVSRLSESLTRLRLHPSYVQARSRVKNLVKDLPAVGGLAYSGLQSMALALRELVEPHVFFEALGVRYTGPIDGHDVAGLEHALRNAAEWDGPIVVHVLTQKGKGYPPAEEDDVQCLHDLKVPAPSERQGVPARSYTDVFGATLLELAEQDERVVAITAAMPGPTGLLPFQARFPSRFIDVGIAEQHAVTAAAGLAMGGMRPVVAVYSTFFSRAFDQANLDVGLHRLPVVFVLDRAGITGDDGPSHHGVLDMAQGLVIPGMTMFAPSSDEELRVMLRTAATLDGPSMIRFPKTPARLVEPGDAGSGLEARQLRRGESPVCILAVGKMVQAALDAAQILAAEGIDASVWDVRVVKPLDPAMVADAAAAELVVTVEDGVKVGGAGAWMTEAILEQAALGEGAPEITILGVPVAYIPQARPAQILAELGLDGPGIADTIRRRLARRRDRTPGVAALAEDPLGQD